MFFVFFLRTGANKFSLSFFDVFLLVKVVFSLFYLETISFYVVVSLGLFFWEKPFSVAGDF